MQQAARVTSVWTAAGSGRVRAKQTDKTHTHTSLGSAAFRWGFLITLCNKIRSKTKSKGKRERFVFFYRVYSSNR